MTAGAREHDRAAALGCRAHTGWAALVVVAGGVARPEVVFRGRAELSDPQERVRKNVYHAARSLELAAAADLVEAAERIAADQAAAALERTLRQAMNLGAAVRSCAVVVGSSAGEARLETILRSHALVHAAEGRLYQGALLQSAESRGLEAIAVPKRVIWEQGEAALGVAQDELREWIDQLRREIGPPWAQDQKLAALAAWIALARSPDADVSNGSRVASEVGRKGRGISGATVSACSSVITRSARRGSGSVSACSILFASRTGLTARAAMRDASRLCVGCQTQLMA